MTSEIIVKGDLSYFLFLALQFHFIYEYTCEIYKSG